MLLCAGLSSSAQQVTVGKMTQVKTDGPAYHPTFTADGKYLQTTSEDYIGLKETNISTGTTRVISTERNAGVKVMKPNVTNGRIVNGTDLKINVIDGNSTTTLTPNGDNERYLWPVLSPDGNRIAYTVSGKGSYIYDIATQNVTYIGKLRAPQWMGNDFVVAMNDRDDGFRVTASSVLVCSVDGSFSQEVTPSSIIAMYPSATENKIAFNNLEGEIFILDITINK